MTGAGMAWTHAQIVGCLRWTGWWVRHVHGDGLVSGQAGLDRPGQAGQASECIGEQGCVEEQEPASKLKSKAQERPLLCTSHPPFRDGNGGSSSGR